MTIHSNTLRERHHRLLLKRNKMKVVVCEMGRVVLRTQMYSYYQIRNLLQGRTQLYRFFPPITTQLENLSPYNSGTYADGIYCLDLARDSRKKQHTIFPPIFENLINSTSERKYTKNIYRSVSIDAYIRCNNRK